MKIFKAIGYLFALLLLSHCGDPDLTVDSAIDEANFYLTQRNCTEARSSLDSVGYQNTNARYISSYASTYACEANYSTITFFANDLDNLSATQAGLFASLAAFSTSGDMTSATDTDFVKLQSAINTILYAGGISASSSANREAIFGTRDNSNLNAYALYMTMVNLGRWLKFYGDADSTGVKGSKGNWNCLFPYDDSGANTVVSAALNAPNATPCDVGSVSANPAISTGVAADENALLCQGIVLFNNFIDLVLNITFSSDTGSNTGSLGSLASTFQTFCTNLASTNGFSTTLCSLKDQSSCEATARSDLESYAAWIFETNYKP